MSDVFVSYKAEDRKRVRPLVEALEADGFSVWWDEQIGGGAGWRHTIEEELNAAKCAVVVWSKRSVGPEGAFVHDEAERAQHRHVYVPVLIDKVHLPLGFGETQALPLIGWHGERSDRRYQAVLAAVARIVGVDVPSVESTRGSAFRVSRRGALVGGAATTVAVAGVGGWLLLKSEAASGSIAVLPFANLSGDPAQAYFSDGIAEELRSALGRIAGLAVVGRTSSEAVRNEAAETAAKKLAVAHILTGSVRQSSSMIRVSAQLIDGDNGLERWSENYDRTPGDSIRIQTDIATKVAQALSVALGQAGKAALTVGGTSNAEAQNLLLRAREVARQSETRAELERAIELTDQSIALDPNYAEAYARKAVFLNILSNNYSTSVEELSATQREVRRFASKAVELAPNFATAHWALARHYQSILDIGHAGREFRLALQLAPGDAAIIRSYSNYAGAAISPAEGIAYAEKALALDPLNRDSHSNRIGALFDARRFAEAVRVGKELERNSPELFDSPILMGDALLLLGRTKEAEQYFQRDPPDSWARITGEAILSARTGDRSGAERGIARMRQLFGDPASYQYGEIYAQLGEKDRAFAALERAWEIKDPGLFRLRVDPALDPLRSDPRYKALERKMNFPARSLAR